MKHFRDSDTYLSHLRSEHNRLEVLTKRVFDRFCRSHDNSWHRLDRRDVAARLDALQDELKKHLHNEDQGGCIDEAVLRLPSLSQAARKLSVASEELLESLAHATHAVAFASRTAAQHAFEQFADDLRMHEQHEERLVAKGFNTFLYYE